MIGPLALKEYEPRLVKYRLFDTCEGTRSADLQDCLLF